MSRPRLFERLAAPARVTVVCAPPGSGKRVLLRSWIGRSGVAGRVAWVPVGRGERDPERYGLFTFSHWILRTDPRHAKGPAAREQRQLSRSQIGNQLCPPPE